MRDSYVGLVLEFLANNDPLVPFTLTHPYDDFAALIRKVENDSRGVGSPGGFVPHSTIWLASDEQKLVGDSNMFNSALLKASQQESEAASLPLEVPL